MGSRPRRRRVGPTDEREQIELLCGWPEQWDYGLIRPLVMFAAPADGRPRGPRAPREPLFTHADALRRCSLRGAG